jgi:hypothetical protein
MQNVGASEEEANARLIAAAPDLLEACKLAVFETYGREVNGILERAIAKATGKSL